MAMRSSAVSSRSRGSELSRQYTGSATSQVRVLSAAFAAGAFHGELVGEEGLGIEEEPADRRGLAVVDTAGGGQAQKLPGHQK
jgi:hypothetical protein